jgi:hypothetical protein
MTGAVGLCLLAFPFLHGSRPQPAPPPVRFAERLVRPARPRSPSAVALWKARWQRMQAQAAVKREREEHLEAVPVEAAAAMDTEEWRRILAARDPGGHLQGARTTALQAVTLARTPAEEYQARVWLVLIECDASRHGAEIAHARRLMALEPWNELSLTSLRRASMCCGLPSHGREASTALEALEK